VSSCVLIVDLAAPPQAIMQMPGYDRAFILVRYSKKPIGVLQVELNNHKLSYSELIEKIQEDGQVLYNLEETILTDWLLQKYQKKETLSTSWSVVICTCERPQDLRRCLDSICSSLPEGGEVIVVDNSPITDDTRNLVEEYPVRYLLEERKGLNWARQSGARAANGDVVIYTDDDVVVDEGWIISILKPFENPRVAAATGLIMPLELHTKAQELFEVYGGFSRGFKRRSFDYQNIAPPAAGYVGAGANMAVRRNLTLEMKLFEAELDAGTAARTGGDAYAFYKLLSSGFIIEYVPEALVFHRHRKGYAELKKTLADYSIGGFAFLTRCFVLHKDWSAIAVAFSWFWQDHCHQLARSLLRPIMKSKKGLPLDLVLHQILSIPRGIKAYFSTIKVENDYLRKKDEKVRISERSV
jgi:glycosyltransferase involved in cell wall biosynthesis